MALPLTRDVTLDGTSKVPSSLLNKLQDAIIAGLRGPFTRPVIPVLVNSGGVWTASGATNYYQTSSGAGSGLLGIQAQEGDRLISLEARSYGNPGGTLQLDLAAYDAIANSTVATATVTDPVRAAGWATVPMTAFSPIGITAGVTLWLTLTASAAASRLGVVRATFDRNG